MVIADYIDASGAEYCRLFDSFEDFHRVTFRRPAEYGI